MSESGDKVLGDRYRIVRRIGSGGMGVVYEAEDLERGQRVALKTVRDPSADKIYRFKREFRALAELSHPNLIALKELVVGDECFFTMELLDGSDFLEYVRGTRLTRHLADSSERILRRLDTNPSLPTDPTPQESLACDEKLLRQVLPQLTHGLITLHAAGIIHRDIKPSNILVTRNGRLVLLDFGLLAIADPETGQSPSQDGHLVGTVKYMAPEQCGGDPATPAVDWYAFGVVLYEALTGRAPFHGKQTSILVDKQQYAPAPPRALVPSVPEDLDGLCIDLLSRRPGERPSGKAVLARLGATLDSQITQPASTPTPATRAIRLAGREAELGALADGLAATERGEPAVVVVRGPSGIGKSALVRAFLERALPEHAALVVLEGRCYERETISYQAMDSLMDNLSRYWRRLSPSDAAALLPLEAAVLPRLFPVLGRVPSVAAARRRRVIADPQELRTRGFGAVRELMRRLVQRSPLVLFLDDLQWVDANSLALLSDLMRPPDPPGLLLILSTRGEPGDALDELVRDTQVETSVTIDLEPLPLDTATELATDLLDPEDTALAPRIAAEAAGNPFFIGQLAQYIQTVEQLETGEIRLEEVIRQRIARLSFSARLVLELVALAGEPISRRGLARASGLSAGDLGREIGLLRTLHFARTNGMRMEDSVELYHDRVRLAVVGGLSDPVKREHYLALALAFEEWKDASDEQLARYWLGAGDAERAAERAHAAADAALARLDFDRAARLYRMALEQGSYDEASARELQTALGTALAQAGRPTLAAEAFSLAARDADDASRLELYRRSAEELLRGGYLEEGLREIENVLATIGLRLAPTPLRAAIAVLGRRALIRLRGLRWHSRDPSKIPAHDLARVDICWTVASALGYVDTIRGAEYQARHLRLALRAGEPRRVVQALVAEACYQGALGGTRRAHHAARRAREVARTLDSPYTEAIALWGTAFVDYQVDNTWRTSLEGFNKSAALLRAHTQAGGWELDTVLLYSCLNRLHMGQLDELSRQVPAYVREAQRRGDRYLVVNLRARINSIWLARDDVDGAERDLAEAIESWMPALESYQVQHYWALFSGCERELYRGDPAAAAKLLDADRQALARSLLLRVQFVRSEVWHLRGRIALAEGARAAGDPRRQARMARRCARKAGRCRLPLAAPFAALLEAGAAQLEGNRAATEVALRRALERLERLDTTLHAQAARRRLGETLGGEAGAKLVSEADDWMSGQGVRNPERMTAMLVPGWPHPG